MTELPQVKRNGFTENVGTDFLAIDANGNVLSRASSAEDIRNAAPNAVAYITGEMLDVLLEGGVVFPNAPVEAQEIVAVEAVVDVTPMPDPVVEAEPVVEAAPAPKAHKAKAKAR